MIRREQVAIGAARRVREVALAIGVARETHVAREPRLVAVPRVAALAALVLGDLMQPGQFVGLVAAATRGRLGEPLWTVRPMTPDATRTAHMAVSRRSFRRVALRACLDGLAAAVWLVTVGTLLVTGRRRRVLLLVARSAIGGARTRVRLVAARALLVPREHERALLGVAAVATSQQRLGSMWQTTVTPLTVRVPAVGRNLLHALRVTITTRRRAG